MSNHILHDGHRVVHLAIVYLERQAYEARQDRRGAGLRADGRDVFALLGTDQRQPVSDNQPCVSISPPLSRIALGGVVCLGLEWVEVESVTYGTMCGPVRWSSH